MRPALLHRGLLLVVALSGCNALTGVGDLATAPSVGDGPGADGGAGDAAGGVDGQSVVEDSSVPLPYHADAATEDDAAVDLDAAVPPFEAGRDSGNVKRVFVTSTMTTAALGGLGGGDLLCNQRAMAASLGGTWRAWLSTMTTNAATRITGTGPWYLTTGVLAVNVGQLKNAPISHRIDRDENGVLANGNVWTATDTDGTFLDSDCAAWTSTLAGLHAATGDTRTSSPAWTAAVPTGCNSLRRVYCFEL